MKNTNKSFIAIGIGVIMLGFIWSAFFTMVSPGYVGVVVDLFGESQGVEKRTRTVGMHWIPPWKELYQFPVFEQNHTWEGNQGFSFQTSEGLAVSADVGITFHLRSDSIPIIFQKYRKGMDEISHIFIRNYIRDAINTAASKMRIEDLYGEGKEEFFKEAQRHVQQDLSPIGIEISRIYLIGRFHFPDSVVTALNSKIEAIQRAQQRENELREAEAQANKNIAHARGEGLSELARAESEAKSNLLLAEANAKANMLIAESITPNLIQWQQIQKWNGELPKVSGQSTPFINFDKLGK